MMSNKTYGVIIADPPWAYTFGGAWNGAASKHYETLKTADLCALPVKALAAPDSVLLMWTTWPQLVDALKVVESWGFVYITGFPWVKVQGEPQNNLFGETTYKTSFGTGFWVRGCTEVVLICKRGKAKPPTDNFCGILSRRFTHSRKPDNLHEYAESMPGPYLEIFARREREGWDILGADIDGRDIRDSLTAAAQGSLFAEAA